MNNEFTETQSEVTDGSRSSNLTPMQPEEGPLRLETVSSSDMDAAMWPSVEVRETLPSQHSPRFTEDTNTVEESNASSSLTHNRDSRDVSREIFVGDLSFFCRDHHLVQLFGRYGVVEKARVRMSDNKKNSLMFAFIRMKTAEAATIAAEALNGFLFMGRTLRVQLCNVDGTPSAYEPKFGFQIHVSFISYQTVSFFFY